MNILRSRLRKYVGRRLFLFVNAGNRSSKKRWKLINFYLLISFPVCRCDLNIYTGLTKILDIKTRLKRPFGWLLERSHVYIFKLHRMVCYWVPMNDLFSWRELNILYFINSLRKKYSFSVALLIMKRYARISFHNFNFLKVFIRLRHSRHFS